MNNSHAALSLQIAVNRVRFGNLSHIGGNFEQVLRQPDALDAPVLSLPDKLDIASDFRARLRLFRNNENGLMLVMESILRLHRNVTLRGLVTILCVSRLFLIVVSIFLLLNLGASPVFMLVLSAVAVEMVDRVDKTQAMSLYPFLLPLTLFAVVIFSYCLARLPITGRPGRAAVIGCAAGAFWGLLGNLRTSYFPIMLVLFVLYFVYSAIPSEVPDHGKARQRFALAALAGSFALGAWAFDWVFIRPLRNLPVSANPEYHVVMHPVVLGLAVPPNEFAKREEIQWLDEVGLKLARRIDPTVGYLTPEYERALKKYYWSLWVNHPGQMAGLYWFKLDYSARKIMNFLHEISLSDRRLVRLSHIFVAPITLTGNGFMLLATTAAVMMIGLGVLKKGQDRCLGHLVSATALVTMLLLLEMATIMSEFSPVYHAPLILGVFGLCLCCYQYVGIRISQFLHRHERLAVGGTFSEQEAR